MVFLFNDVVIDLGDARETLVRSGCPIPLSKASLMKRSQLLMLAREAVFARPDFPHSQPEKAAGLAALLHICTGANAMLCLRRDGATSAEEVPLRLAEVSLTVMGDLARRQKEEGLTPEDVDHAVWAAC